MEKPNVDIFEGLDLSHLQIDQAYVRFQSTISNVFYYIRSDNCYKCPFQRKEPDVSIDGNHIFKLSTHYPWHFLVRNSGTGEYVSQFRPDNSTICGVNDVVLGEFGVYNIKVAADQCGPVKTLVDPVNDKLALLVCFLILAALGLLHNLVKWLVVRKGYTRQIERLFKSAQRQIGYEVELDERAATSALNNAGKARIRSLDTFRGITIALMIFVNDGAGGYWFLEHATWNGLQVADLVFPWFLWIMGVAIPMSLRSSVLRRKEPKGVVFIGICKRSVKLFMLGFFWNTIGWINLELLRVPGVLQRFSITYFVVATTGLVFMPSEEDDKKDENGNQSKILSHFTDALCLWQRWIVAAIFVAAHCLITFAMPVPNCPTGYLGPGGLFDDSSYDGVDCVGGAAGYIDRVFFGSNHIYGNPTAKFVYGSGPFDPEGILGSFTSVLQVFLGYQAGQIIMSYQGHKGRLIRFVIWALLNGAIGFALNGATRDEGLIPINKNLWSLSFVFVTTGAAFLLMAAVYALVDAYHVWQGEPFIYAGMNSIVLYLGHSIAWQMAPFNYISGPMNTHWDKLVESLWGTSAWLIVAYVMHRNRAFISV